MRSGLFILLLILAVLAGCGNSTPPPQQACTLIGCSDGLTVVVTGAPATPYMVEISLPDGSVQSRQCDGSDGCPGGLFFGEVTAENVVVRVTGDGGTSEATVRPEYEQVQPNGPDCPPTCSQARVEVGYQPSA